MCVKWTVTVCLRVECACVGGVLLRYICFFFFFDGGGAAGSGSVRPRFCLFLLVLFTFTGQERYIVTYRCVYFLPFFGLFFCCFCFLSARVCVCGLFLRYFFLARFPSSSVFALFGAFFGSIFFLKSAACTLCCRGILYYFPPFLPVCSAVEVLFFCFAFFLGVGCGRRRTSPSPRLSIFPLHSPHPCSVRFVCVCVCVCVVLYVCMWVRVSVCLSSSQSGYAQDMSHDESRGTRECDIATDELPSDLTSSYW